MALSLLLSQAAVAASPSLDLTDAEQQWLQQHPTIRLAVDIDWSPFEYIDENGSYVGMAAEYIGLVEERLGIHFEVEKNKPWPEVVESVKNRELDMYSCVVATPQRREYASFTKPYLSFPMVIVTTDQVAYVSGLKELKNETVAVVKGYATQDLLEQNYPELDLYLADTVSDALEALSLGRVFAYVGNIASVSDVLKRKGLTNLKISGETPYKYELSMAVRNDWPEFTPILQKALDSISEQEQDQIYQNWIKLRYEYGTDYSLLWKILAGVSLIILIILFWNRSLNREIHRRTEAEHKLNDAHQRLELGLRGGDLGTWDWNIQSGQIKVNERWFTMLGYPADELQFNFDYWAGLIHADDIEPTDLKVKQLLDGEVDFYDAEFRLKAASGDYQWIRARGQMVERDESGQPLRAAGVHQDIDQLKKAQHQLEQVNQQLLNYFDIVNKFVITSATDVGGTITETSDAFSKISGYSQDELIGTNHRILRHPDMPDSIYEELWQTIANGKTWEGELKNRKKDGGYYWVHAYISPTLDEQNNITGYTAIRQDITDKKRAEELSITDELTTLFNRRYFNIIFPREIARAEREKKVIGLILLDVDYFKLYNDNYGHHQGDIALQSVALALKNTIRRAGDFAFRIGGEEFGGIVSTDSPEQVTEIAEKLRRNIEGLEIKHEYNPKSLHLTVSIGVKTHVCSGRQLPEMNEFYSQADDALYQAKAKGRNQVISI
ncbi:MAG: diguanylate cyclase [Gammaproteobacteria bacterium]|nr:diguanylate cyclase [Gammaproteobacteria bacterium]